MQMRAFFSHVAPSGGDENLRPGFDNGQLPVGQTGSAASQSLPMESRDPLLIPRWRFAYRGYDLCLSLAFAHGLTERTLKQKLSLTVLAQLPIVAPRCPREEGSKNNTVRCPSG